MEGRKRKADRKLSDAAEWTTAQLALTGKIEPDRNYASYGPGELFTVVGPTLGPLHIRGENARKAWARPIGDTKSPVSSAFGQT